MRRLLRWGWRVLAAAVVAAGVGYLPMRVFGGGGLERARRMKRELVDLRRRVAERRADNADRRGEVDALRNDPRMVERVVRDELGLVKPGELVFRFERRDGDGGEAGRDPPR